MIKASREQQRWKLESILFTGVQPGDGEGEGKGKREEKQGNKKKKAEFTFKGVYCRL